MFSVLLEMFSFIQAYTSAHAQPRAILPWLSVPPLHKTAMLTPKLLQMCETSSSLLSQLEMERSRFKKKKKEKRTCTSHTLTYGSGKIFTENDCRISDTKYINNRPAPTEWSTQRNCSEQEAGSCTNSKTHCSEGYLTLFPTWDLQLRQWWLVRFLKRVVDTYRIYSYPSQHESIHVSDCGTMSGFNDLLG